MAQKTVEQKIKDCKQLIIQNMEKTIQHKMVYMFLKDRKKEAEVKQYSVNGKDGIIKIEFLDHDKAEAFYNEANFNDKILIRPFNIYLNLTLTENEMKKYYLEGITEQNQRKLFEIARKIGICKLYTSYGTGARAKLKSTGLLSFIRKDPISEGDFNILTEQLKTIGIKISNYIQEKGMKVSLNLINYVSDAEYQKEETELQELAEKNAKDIVQKFVGKVEPSHLSVLVKKKQVNDPKNPDNKIKRVLSSALFEFNDAESTFQYYQKVRVGIKDEDNNTKVKLFFHNEENNSYLSLITQGLSKPEKISDKQFEEELIKSFREINPNVLQVNIYPVIYNNSYIGRVYLKNEEEGRNFLVDYSTFRSKIYHHYKEKLAIFNINIDGKTLRKMKLAEKKAKETEEKIKKQSEANRRQNRRAPNQMPLPPNLMGVGQMMPPSMVQNPGMMMPPMGGMPPPIGDKMMIPPPMYGRPPELGHFAKGPMPVMPQNVKYRVNTLLRDRQRFIDMDENTAKRAIGDPLRAYVQEQGISIGQEAAKIANQLIKERTIPQIFSLLETPEQFREAALSIKNNQN